MILDDLADLLTSGGVATKGTNLFIGDRMPDTPSELLMIRLSLGMPGAQVMGQSAGNAVFDTTRFQLEARSSNYVGADTLLRSARNVLDQLSKRTINGTTYYYCKALQGDPLSLGVDQERRSSVVMNFEVIKGR